ncbi:glycosyltransferase [Tenggerimyces flavus]|uniref:Glycosyltransferase n=1 Tax=Tenggerimyces flavus TaxID=1708749 RepID=A0ABV7Y1S8_9ACTN|nr:glycosyltransferase [Tenggerimyces flavus]MBM7790937.1 UDP:flavonoid glycosyltransferase YjiC (YdhE family) [Tenggerimyces flavus]
MRVLLATTSGMGHYVPMLPFAAALVRAGHEVQVAAPRSFAAAVERSGYPYWPCADVDPAELAAAHARMNAAPPEQRNAAFVEVAADLAPRAILPGMLTAIDAYRPDLVLREVGELGSAMASELRGGIPQVQVLIGLAKFGTLLRDVVGPIHGRARVWAGLPAEGTTSVPSVSLLPLSYEEPGTAGSEVRRYVDASVLDAAEPLPDWSNGNADPLVYVTFGTVSASVPQAVATFRAVVESLASLPIRLLATVGDGGDPSAFDGLPANVRVERFVPQASVLPHAAAMVCHGGMGTVLGGLSAGVPMVVVPQFADQPDNAARVEALGAGLQVRNDHLDDPVDPAWVAEATRRVLAEPSFRTGAEKLRADIHALPPADEAVAFFEELAS